MKQLAIQPIQSNVIRKKNHGALCYIRLNRHELECVELALSGFAENLRHEEIPHVLASYSIEHLSAQLCYLQYWIEKPALKARLRSDGRNTVLWPFTSSELVDWLLRVCQSCVSEDAILIAAADAAGCDYVEYANMYANRDYNHSLSNEMVCANFSAFQCYYNEIAKTCKESVVRKLTFIQENDYPLLPTASAIN